jgi:glycosyltransferase involved in cell wall biosynthesis
MKARGWFRRSVLRLLVKYAYPRANAVVANSQDGAREVESVLGWPEGRVAAIYNPTVNDSIEELSKLSVDDEWFNSNEIPVVVGLGRLVEQKDFSSLIRAFASAREKVACRLVIFGDGHLRENLIELSEKLDVADHVRIEPFVDNPYKYLSRADLFVLSSKYEGLPNALIEAQACGISTISTDCPTGPREILENGANGILVPVGDNASMASAISELLLNRAKAQEFVVRASEGLDRFTPAQSYLQYEHLVEASRSD